MRSVVVCVLLLAASLAQADPKPGEVRVINTPLPVTGSVNVSGSVGIVGTPTVNANVSGEVGIAGTPTVNANVSGEVGITGTPTVNANVSGEVAITGTPTVNIGSTPGVAVGVYFASCTFNQAFCQASDVQQAAPGTAFRIDAIQGRTFGSGNFNTSAVLFLNIATPGLGSDFAVPCVFPIGNVICSTTAGIHVTAFRGMTFVTTPASQGSGRVIVYYTVVNLAD